MVTPKPSGIVGGIGLKHVREFLVSGALPGCYLLKSLISAQDAQTVRGLPLDCIFVA